MNRPADSAAITDYFSENMKNIIITTVALLLIASLANAETLRSFTATSKDQTAVLEWTSNVETGVVEYVVQRSLDGRAFHKVKSVKPKGSNNTYRYVDSDLFKDRINTFYYRIEVVFVGGQTEQSQTEEVSMSFSSVHRTWGSLKAMFR